MRINGVFIRVVMVAGLGLLATGCSGINTQQTVSPASFFLPGIMKANPAPVGRQLQVTPVPIIVVAQVR